MEGFKEKYDNLIIELSKANEQIEYLQTCKNNYDVLTKYLEDFVWVMDKHFNVTYVSPSIINTFTKPEKGFTKDVLLGLVPFDTRVLLKDEMLLRLSGKAKNEVKKWVTQIEDVNGLVLWIEVTTNPIINNNGEFEGVMGVAHNITKQKLSEIALVKSEEIFRTIFENTDSLITIQTDKKFLLVNKAWEHITGYTTEEAKILEPFDLIHPVGREFTFANVKKRLNGEDIPSNFQFHLIDKQYREKWINVSDTVIDYNGAKAILTVGSDITERKNTEIELNKFSTGIMNSPLSIVITDIDGFIEYVNPYFIEKTGYSYDEAIGANPKILSSGNNSIELYEDLWSTILSGEVWKGEFHNKTKGGLNYWESARIAPIIDENGIISNFIAIKEDISERKRTFELIEQSEKDLRDINAKKDKFFSIIAHDLRSPFSGLVGLISILKSSINDLSDEKVENYLELINDSAQNTFKLLENLLSWAKSQTGKIEFNPKNLNLKEIVSETVSIVSITAANKAIDIEINIDKNVSVFADADMIKTVLRNLISNSLKYTNKNGFIRIFVKRKAFNSKNYFVVGVEDNGVGISKENQGKIFNIEENYTTKGTEKEMGTGLGLLLCKEFVERHGGRIWCKSVENDGSIFYFSLPQGKML